MAFIKAIELNSNHLFHILIVQEEKIENRFQGFKVLSKGEVYQNHARITLTIDETLNRFSISLIGL